MEGTFASNQFVILHTHTSLLWCNDYIVLWSSNIDGFESCNMTIVRKTFWWSYFYTISGLAERVSR